MKKDFQLIILLTVLSFVYFYFVKKKNKNISKILCLIAIVFFSSKLFYDNYFKSTIEGNKTIVDVKKLMNTFLYNKFKFKLGKKIRNIDSMKKKCEEILENGMKLFSRKDNDIDTAVSYFSTAVEGMSKVGDEIKNSEGTNAYTKELVSSEINNIKYTMNELFNIMSNMFDNSQLKNYVSSNTENDEKMIFLSFYKNVECTTGVMITTLDDAKAWAKKKNYDFREVTNTPEIKATPPGAYRVTPGQDLSLSMDPSGQLIVNNTVYWNSKDGRKNSTQINLVHDDLENIHIKRIIDSNCSISEENNAHFKNFSKKVNDLYFSFLKIGDAIHDKTAIFLIQIFTLKFKEAYGQDITEFTELVGNIFNENDDINEDKNEFVKVHNDFLNFLAIERDRL
jgi:hypothetical protein